MPPVVARIIEDEHGAPAALVNHELGNDVGFAVANGDEPDALECCRRRHIGRGEGGCARRWPWPGGPARCQSSRSGAP